MAKKKIKRNETKYKGKSKKGGNMFVTNILIPALSLIISTIAIIIGVYNYMLATKEYQYKLDPIVTAYAPSPIIENKNEYIYLCFDKINVQILERNKLQKSYLIDSDETVHELKIYENKLVNSDKKEELNFDVDIEDEGTFYRYKYLLLKGLDDDYDLYLILSVENNKKTDFYSFDEVTVTNLKKGNEVLKNIYSQYTMLNEQF